MAECSGSMDSVVQRKVQYGWINAYMQKQYVFLPKWGLRGFGNSQFGSPTGIEIDPSTGNMYVAYLDYNRIQGFDTNGNFVKFGTAGFGNSQFDSRFNVSINPCARKCVISGDTSNNRIYMFALDP